MRLTGTQQRLIVCFTFLCVFSAVFAAVAQDTVTAEAINQANVRSGAGIEFPVIAEINVGTRYPVVGRSALYPWVVIALSETQRGWVFRDLVVISGNLETVPVTEAAVDTIPPTPSLPVVPTQPEVVSTPGNEAATPTLPVSTPTTDLGVQVEAQGELNIRFGPGIDYPRIGTMQAGERFPVLRRHTQVEWVEINYNGKLGWVYIPAVRIIGNINVVPTTSLLDFGYPTLTPTLPMVIAAAAPWQATPAGAPSGLAGVANGVYDLMLSQGFDPSTSKQGSVFILDLARGESYALNPNVAYSGTSLIKIAVMVAYYRKQNTTPTLAEAQTLADMMVCSENLSSNAILRTIGDGSEYRGAEFVTDTLRTLGIQNTFLVGPFFVGNPVGQPTPTVEPVRSIDTEADQVATDPDPFNQMTPADLGWLLGGIYQCALDGTGSLIDNFPGEVTMNECRQMVRMMRSNRVPSLIGGGVPEDVPLARKYGWVNESHGDAAILTTAGGDYVLVIMLHTKTWLEREQSFPLIAEISRRFYNHFNSSAPVAQINDNEVPFCSLATIEQSLFPDLTSGSLPPIR